MSNLKVDTLQNTAGTKSVPVNTVVDGSAKAWVNFNGTGTVAIRTSFNVSSITDNGTGDYTVNFATAFADTSYSANGRGQSGTPGWGSYSFGPTTYTASSYRSIYARDGTGAILDPAFVDVAVFR